ncbi:MAG TPA: helix-turn-helix transcriptional regulator [Candidatus Saccharimonadales bacterium]|jgi:transcriptional regulator with XRE-family HTH domain|nr:helix-turn-helix transcriptional regulator [Candidatus Saccharimonadales bacterium]
MTGHDLREGRKRRGWTQQEAARRLRVSQGYLSMLERERRSLPGNMAGAVLKTFEVSPLALPFHGESAWAGVKLVEELSALGYPGFARSRRRANWNPAELLLAALSWPNLERRVAEALPWLALTYYKMEWRLVIRKAKLHDLQNRLGLVVTLARRLTERQTGDSSAQLILVEGRLRPSMLAKTGTFCHENMTQAERRWLVENSSVPAKQWNLLSDLSPEHLPHAEWKY